MPAAGAALGHNDAMNCTTTLPACCTTLDSHWPLPHRLHGVELASSRFDAARLDPDDFQRAGIAPISAAAKRQSEYLAGRVCAREALRRATGTPQVPTIGEDRAPCWPADTIGSITHGAGFAAAVAARREHWRGLGLDVERPLTPARADRLVRQILTPGELHHYRTLADEERAQLLTLSFSLKESLFKALYPLVRQRFYFQHAELLEHSADGRARLRLLIDLSPEWQRGTQLDGQFARLDEHLISLVSVPA
jgi:enterobactin synthetase component D